MNKRLPKILSVLVLLSGYSAASAQEHFYEPESEASVRNPFSGKVNLLLNKPVTDSAHWSDRVPEFVVDGKTGDANSHWAGTPLPASLTVDMGKETEVSGIWVVFFWGGGRIYEYIIESSVDGKDWQSLVDRRSNTQKSTKSGFVFKFKERSCRYLRIRITGGSAAGKGGHIVEFQAFGTDLEAAGKEGRTGAWSKIEDGLHGSLGSVYTRYKRNAIPVTDGKKTWNGTAWRGERVNAQFVVWTTEAIDDLTVSATPLKSAAGKKLGTGSITPHFVRYTKARDGIQPDIIENMKTVVVKGCTTRPVWVEMNVPQSAKPGKYTSTVSVSSSKVGTQQFDVELEVLAMQLPAPEEWKFHLDLWQNPFSVARIFNLKLWSKEHFAKMRPLFTMLGNAGQKCLTVSIINRPWGGQTYDPFQSMVKWTKKADGSWNFDYSIMDRWVEFMAECGISQQINCYTMIPWGDNFYYFDEASNETKTIKCQPGTEEFNAHWRPFLIDFVKHLKKKGWMDKTTIAMDERPHKIMIKLLAFMKETAPELKIASAINYAKKEGSGDLYDISVSIGHAKSIDPDYLAYRQKAGMKTTFYVCCGPAQPNTFPHSPPAESTWMGIHAAALGYDGFLRWAYNSWVEDPFLDTKHLARNWPDGDCFMVYPGARSSLRFEQLREGIEDYEKIRILKAKAAESDNPAVKAALLDLGNSLKRCSNVRIRKSAAETQVKDVIESIEKLSRLLSQ